MGNRAFKSHHGTYLHAEHDGLQMHHEIRPSGHFHVENHGSHITLRTHHGKYVAINHHKQPYLTHHIHDKDAHFVLERHPHGKVAIKNPHHGLYFGDHHGQVRAHHYLEDHELWEELMVN
eukprot:GEZU01008297.1.p2 GENE.GEZU01008297.1~~GEZU01008297.1.p2  ORF type:complete len:120 (+),score=31.24 GEZU01008297.1:122-481(+)